MAIQVNTSYDAYMNYMSNMIEQNKPNILDYDEWIQAVTAPIPDEFKTTSEEMSYEEAEHQGVVWATEEELKSIGELENE